MRGAKTMKIINVSLNLTTWVDEGWNGGLIGGRGRG